MRYPNKEIAELEAIVANKNREISALEKDIVKMNRKDTVTTVLCILLFIAFIVGALFGQWTATWPLGS